jgi:uncharacterized membrane protein
MSIYIIAYFIILLAFLVLDMLWLGVIAKNCYRDAIGKLMRANFIKWPWILFYLLYGSAILYFVIAPNLGEENYIKVLLSATLLGATIYGAYNLTCYSILESWPLKITLKDWAWGTFLTAASSLISYYVVMKLL